MRLFGRRRNFVKPYRTGRRGPIATSNARIDVWISRLASISQSVLVVLTAAGFYFTVLPLYQKAALEEAIAKKESELKELTAALDKAYSRTRFSALKNFVFSAGVECSGLMLPARNQHLIGKIDPPDRKPYAQETLEIDPKKCLLSRFERSKALNEIRAQDRTVLGEAVAKITQELDKKRMIFIDQSSISWKSPEAVASANAYSNMVREQIYSLYKLVGWQE